MTEYRITAGNLIPTLNRHMVGFDRLFGDMDRLFTHQAPSYPPYNIERISNTEFVITIAVAGFSKGDLSVTVYNGQLSVHGHKDDKNRDVDHNEGFTAEQTWLHKGIATRDFTRSWNLAEFVEVKSAECKDGMLEIHLKQEVPEALKPKEIEIKF